jgi:adenylate kinase family enzyme
MPETRTPAPRRIPRRIVVSGTTGSGKSTTARRIAAITGAPCVELDALHWEANWTPAPEDVFRQRIREATAGDAWVADGNYAVARELTWGRADLVVWLDYTIARIFWQLTRRTCGRVIRREELWHGNRESVRTALLSRDSLYVWALQTHWTKRRKYPEIFAKDYPHLRVVRIRSPRALERWMREFESAVGASELTAS